MRFGWKRCWPYLKNGSTIQAPALMVLQPITAGADFTAANESQVMPSSAMAADQGSVLNWPK